MKKNIMKNTAAKAVLAAGVLAMAVCAGCQSKQPAETTAAAESTEAAGETAAADYRKPETYALEEMGTGKLIDYDNMTVDLVKNEEPTETDVDEYISRLKKFRNAEYLTRQMCLELIDSVTVNSFERGKQEREIHIYYKFIDKGYTGKSDD